MGPSTFLGLVALALAVTACGRTGGDPSGQVLRKLEPVAGAVPSGSSSVAVHRYPAVWQNKCPDNPGGHSGWSEVAVTATFVTAMPSDVVTSDVGRSLVEMGWSRRDAPTPQGGRIAHWTKSVGQGHEAEAFLYPVPQGSQNWFLTARWRPPGFALPGC